MIDDYKQLEDEEILKLSLKDPSHFSALIDRYEESFMRAAFGIVHNRQEAEDIVQETFTKIYVNGRKFKKQPNVRFKSWAYKVLINTSFTHYQKQKKVGGKTEYLDNLLYDGDEGAAFHKDENLGEISDARAQVGGILEKMPPHLGRLLKFYYLDDMSYQNIAEAEKISMSTLKMRLFRAKRLFKKLSLD